jgi:hypothetical protein
MASEFVSETASRYLSFLQKVKSVAPGLVAIATIFPPALKDEYLRRGYMNGHIAQLNADQSPEELLRALKTYEFPSLEDRTSFHDNFNLCLHAIAVSEGFGLVDDFSPLLSGKVLDERFIWRSGGSDHHIDYHPDLRGALRKALSSLEVGRAALGAIH